MQQLRRVGGGRPSPESIGDIGREQAPIPEVFNGAVFVNLDVPPSARAGNTVEITGVVGFDCPLCAVDRNVRVVAEFDGDERTQAVGGLSGRGEDAPFTFTLPAPNTPGETMTVRLKAEHQTPATGTWHTDNTEGPFTINVVTRQEQAVNDAIGFVPWAIGGGIAGVGTASVIGRRPTAGAVGGVGVGIAAKALAERSEFLDLPQGPDFPTTAVLATAALFGAGAIFLSVSGAGALTRPLGETAGGAIERVRGELAG